MKQTILTLKNAWDEGKRILKDAGIEEAALDAWYLLEHTTGISRASYYAWPDKEIGADETEKYLTDIRRRAKRIPLQHITGWQEFMGLPFRVNEHVLIPRQDTEVLVECGIGKLRQGMSVLDMCTGSGCIIISMAVLGEKSCRVCETNKFTGADVSGEALLTARENAHMNHAAVSFKRSNLFQDIEGKYDIIISNPPYIPTAVIQGLMEEVRLHDPYIALDGKEDGLYFYRRITEEGREFLNEGGYLLFETGHDQADAVLNLMKDAGFTEIEVKKDLAGLDRVVMGLYNKG